MGIFRHKIKDKPRREAASNNERAVFSFYQNRVIPKNDSLESIDRRQQQAKSQYRRLHSVTILTLVVIAGCFIYILSLDSNPKIVIVNEQDQATASLLRTVDVYKNAAQKDLRSSIFNKTKITANTSGLARKVQEQFPEVSEATVSLPLINRRPVYYLQITQPTFLLTKGTDVYALDQQGRVIMKGDETLPASNLVRIDDQTAQSANVGEQFLPTAQIEFMQNVQAQLAGKGITVMSFVLPPLANEVYVKQADKPYIVKMTFVGDPRQQSGAFLAVKGKLEADKVNPAEYIDVRVEEHAYYK